MKLREPTPYETTQWILEAYVENMLGDMSDREHTQFITHLETACEEMNTDGLRLALRTAIDIAEELALELSDSGVELARILEIVQHGRGRLNVTGGLPANPSKIGALSALRLAAKIARTDLWGHAAHACDDETSLEAFDMDCEEAADAIRARSLGQLLLVGDWLRQFSATLDDAGARATIARDRCVSRDGARCRGHIDDWSAIIRAQSEALYTQTGSMDRVWQLHGEFFSRVMQ